MLLLGGDSTRIFGRDFADCALVILWGRSFFSLLQFSSKESLSL